MQDSDSPRVTVYVVSHNYGRYLRQAIDSALAQTVEDVQVIAIDDGSTDESRAIIESYIGTPRFTPIFQQNKGLTVTNNIALRAARGRYIMRLDADDWLDPHAVEILANVLDRHPEVGLVFPDYFHVDADGSVLEHVRRHDFDGVTLRDVPAHGACTMIRRRCLEEIGGYDESLRCHDGYDLWIRFIEHFEIRNVNLPLFFYRRHSHNLTRDEQRILATRLDILRRHSQRRGRAPWTIGVVPVRGASTEPGSPELRNLGGRPLIDWTLDAALASKHLRDVIVTTPDQALIEYIRSKFGDRVTTLARDRHLALPNTPLFKTLQHAASNHEERTGNRVEAVLQMGILSPFRAPRHLDAAVDTMTLFDAAAVIGVRCEADDFYRHNGSGLTPVRRQTTLRLENEDIYRAAGQLRLWSRSAIDAGSPHPDRTGHVVLDERAALVLRTPLDWALADALARSDAS